MDNSLHKSLKMNWPGPRCAGVGGARRRLSRGNTQQRCNYDVPRALARLSKSKYVPVLSQQGNFGCISMFMSRSFAMCIPYAEPAAAAK